MSKCVACEAEIKSSDYMINGEPAVCSWRGPNIAHVTCMSINQLEDAIESWLIPAGVPALIYHVVERRLKYLREKKKEKWLFNNRWEAIEID